MISWISKAWQYLRLVFTLLRTVACHDKKIDEIETKVEELLERQPPRPYGLQVINGFYWARDPISQQVVAYCPACSASDKYVPLQRETHWADGSLRQDGFYGYRCPNCAFYRELSVKDENKAEEKFR